MLILHLGVVDVPYTHGQPAPKRVAVRRSNKAKTVKAITAAPTGGQTTGDVAEILESKYHVMELFWEVLYQEEIMRVVENDVSGKIEALIMGTPHNPSYSTAEGEIEALFKNAISNQEFDALGIPGVPTQAALDGVNSRLKAKRGEPRPSFRDTGLYQTSFKVQIENS